MFPMNVAITLRFGLNRLHQRDITILYRADSLTLKWRTGIHAIVMVKIHIYSRCLANISESPGSMHIQPSSMASLSAQINLSQNVFSQICSEVVTTFQNQGNDCGQMKGFSARIAVCQICGSKMYKLQIMTRFNIISLSLACLVDFRYANLPSSFMSHFTD